MDPPLLVEVLRTRREPAAREAALVLASRGLEHRAARADSEFLLLVEEDDAARARWELTQYMAENRAFARSLGRGVDLSRPPVREPWLGSAWYALLLLGAFAVQGASGSAVDAGIADARAILGGEVQRAVTALLLHADLLHLAGNLVFGALFGLVLAAELGNGVAWAAILLGGTLGNLLNAVAHGLLLGHAHRSLGASTAVFAAVGTIGAVEGLRRHAAGEGRLRRLAPPVLALVMLGLYGMGGERTDVLAHVCGLAAGALVGVAIALSGSRLAGRGPQAAAGAGLLLLVACLAAWGLPWG